MDDRSEEQQAADEARANADEAKALAAEAEEAAQAAEAYAREVADAVEAEELLQGPLVFLEEHEKPVSHPDGDGKVRRITVGGKNYEHVGDRDYHGRTLWVYRQM